jgi:hypothetical protein
MLAFDIPEWLVYGVIGIVLVAIVVAVSAARARKRTQALADAARDIGFRFEGKAWSDPEQSGDLKMAVFQEGSGRAFRNIMTGDSAGLRAALFDYSYVTGGGTESSTTAQTVASFRTAGVALPQFELAPAGLMAKIGNALVHNNIRFDADPEFSKRYQLTSGDEPGTRALFTPALLSFFKGLDPQAKWRFAGLGQTLIVYRSGKRIKPADLKAFFAETSVLAGSFFSLAAPRNA